MAQAIPESLAIKKFTCSNTVGNSLQLTASADADDFNHYATAIASDGSLAFTGVDATAMVTDSIKLTAGAEVFLGLLPKGASLFVASSAVAGVVTIRKCWTR